jgi:hypothetical protein
MPRPQPFHRLPSRAAQLLLAVLFALLLACSGGGGGGGSSTAAGTGSVGVLVTDAPVDPHLFSSILVTFTEVVLIGEGGQESIFSGLETIDLRDLEDVGKLVALGRDVPARSFQKIRLELDEVELVPADGSPSIFPRLPPKLDLNLQGPVELGAGELLLLQIDFDAGNSVHIVEQGNGGFGFRPVVLADALGVRIPGKLVLLEGVVDALDSEADSFLLCDTGHSVSRPDGDRRVMDDDGPPDPADACVRVVTDAETSVFDENGDPLAFDLLMEGDEASVLGRFLPREEHGEHAEALVLLAEVIQLGPPGTARAVDGEVLTEVGADGRFTLSVGLDQLVAERELVVELQPGAKVFSRAGKPLTEADIQPGTPARVVGVLDPVDEFLKASVVTLDLETMMLEKLSGEITEVRLDGAELDVDTGEEVRCVEVPEDAAVFLLELSNGDAVASPIDRSELVLGDEVQLAGTPGECLVVEKLIVFREISPN